MITRDKKTNTNTIVLGHLKEATITPSAVYYYGACSGALIAFIWGEIRFPKDCVIRKIALNSYFLTTSSTQTASLYIRKNNTTDYLISSTLSYTSSPINQTYDVNIPISAGDRIVAKWVTPAWATAPQNVIANLLLEYE